MIINIKTTLKRVPVLTWGSIVIILFFMFYARGFSNPRNLDNILKNSSMLIIVGMGMTLTILSGQIDLSVGGVMSAAGMIGAVYIKQFASPGTTEILLTILISMGVGLAFGCFNGLMIGKFNFNYWLVTFASLSLGYGLAKVVTGGNILGGYSRSFRFVGGGEIWGISTSIWIAAAVVAIIALIVMRSRFGFHVYAVGDSEQCALQSGINVARIRFLIYAISGLLAGLAGIVLVSRTNSAAPITGEGYEFNAIAAVVVGGTTFDGGKGGIWGTIVGAVIIQAIRSGLQLSRVNVYWQQTLIGLFIASIIVIEVISSRRKRIDMLRRYYKA